MQLVKLASTPHGKYKRPMEDCKHERRPCKMLSHATCRPHSSHSESSGTADQNGSDMTSSTVCTKAPIQVLVSEGVLLMSLILFAN